MNVLSGGSWRWIESEVSIIETKCLGGEDLEPVRCYWCWGDWRVTGISINVEIGGLSKI